MGAGLVTQVVRQLGRSLHQGLHGRVLGVQDAQRVGVQAAAAVFVQLLQARGEVVHQCGPVGSPLGRLTQAVELKADVATHLQPQGLPQAAHHEDQLGIDVWPRKAQRLDVELVELAVATLLRTLVTEHRADGPDPQRPVVQGVVLDHRAHDAGRDLRPQRQGVAVHRVPPGVHLLLDDIGGLSDAAHEQACRLDDGCKQVLVGVARHDSLDRALEPAPDRGIGKLVLARDASRQDVIHAFDGCNFVGHEMFGAGAPGQSED